MLKWLSQLFGKPEKSQTPKCVRGMDWLTRNLLSDLSRTEQQNIISSGIIPPKPVDIPQIYETKGSLLAQVAYHVETIERIRKEQEKPAVQYSFSPKEETPSVRYAVDAEDEQPTVQYSLREEDETPCDPYAFLRDIWPKRLDIIDGQLVEVPDDGHAPTFSNEVKRIMDERGITATELCSRILMDRRLFSKLNTDPNYRPSKETAVSICFGLQLSYKEACVLLERAGFSLSRSIRYDTVVEFLLMKSVYDIDTINDILDRFKLKCIGARW